MPWFYIAAPFSAELLNRSEIKKYSFVPSSVKFLYPRIVVEPPMHLDVPPLIPYTSPYSRLSHVHTTLNT